MFKVLRSLFAVRPTVTHSIFANYYTTVVRSAGGGTPTADEAKRDLASAHMNQVYIGGF